MTRLGDRHLRFDAGTLTATAAAAGTLALSGLIVPFGQRVVRMGVPFTFEKGSLRLRGNPSDVKLLLSHDPDRPVGYATDLVETDTGWEGTFTLPDLPQSVAAHTEVVEQLRDAFSVGVTMSEEFFDEFFEAAWSMRDLDTPLVFDGELVETSLVAIPQFNDARASAHRTTPVLTMAKEPTVTDTPLAAPAAPDLSPITERLDQLEARLVQTFDRPTGPVDVRAVFTDAVRRFGVDATDRTLRFADMVSSSNTGLTSTERTSREIIDYFDSVRYFLNHVEKIPFPETGIVHTLPKKSQRSLVGKAAELVEAPSRAVQIGTEQFTGEWYKSWLPISYELIRTSSPDAVAVAVDDMLDQAAAESEKLFVAAVENTASPGGAAINFSSYAQFVTSIRAAVRTVRFEAGAGAPKVALTPDSWDKLLTFVDATDRRLLSTTGPSNADGSALLTASEVNLAGILFFESPHSTVDVAYNDNALKASELPPLQISADAPSVVGRDVAVLGNIMCIDRVPFGIVKFSAT